MKKIIQSVKIVSALHIMSLICFLIIVNPSYSAQDMPEAKAVFYVQ